LAAGARCDVEQLAWLVRKHAVPNAAWNNDGLAWPELEHTL